MNIKQKSELFRSIVNEMADLYEKKNSNYGDSFGKLYEELGPTSGLVPLYNKLHRAASLIKGDKNNFESLEDTLKDLACYAIMNLIEMKNAKQSDKADNVGGVKLTDNYWESLPNINSDPVIGTHITYIRPCDNCSRRFQFNGCDRCRYNYRITCAATGGIGDGK